MAHFTASKRFLGLVSAVLFVVVFLILHHSHSPASTSRTTPTPQSVDPPEQASGPGSPLAAQPLAKPPSDLLLLLPTTGLVLPGERVLHNAPATYPRLTRLRDKSILLAFTHTESQPPTTRILTVQRSVDNGKTFAPWGTVARCPGDCGNLVLLEVDNGGAPRILAAFRNHDVAAANDDDGRSIITWFRITVCESLDGGRTWRFVTQAAEKAAPMGLWEPFLRVGAAGVVQLVYSREAAPQDQDSVMQVSVDQGRTWSAPRVITGGGGGGETALRDGMAGIVATADRGRPVLVMVVETTRRGWTFTLEAVLSYDDGETWGERQVVFEGVPAGRNAGAPQIESFGNGGLAVVFMTDMDVEPTGWPLKAAVKVLFGGPVTDGRIQWGPPKDVFPNVSLWPGIFKLSDTQLMAVCEHDEAVRGRILEWGT